MKKLLFGFTAILLLLGMKGYSQKTESLNGIWLEDFVRVDKTYETGNQTFFKIVQDPEVIFEVISPQSMNFVSKEVAGITVFECSVMKDNTFNVTTDTTVKMATVHHTGKDPFHYQVQVAYN